MGASASSLPLAQIKLTEKECKIGLNELFDKKVFDAYADSDNMVSIDAIFNAYKEKTDVFLTHDWGKELGMDNHERVSRVNEALKARGLRTWFDSEKMEGNVKKKMISGIENAYCIVVFITKRYMDKVDSDNAEDNCQLEFNYSSRRKTARKMVPVVMEARMRTTADWVGEVGMVLGGTLYVDLATDDSFEARMDELYSRILSVTGTYLKAVEGNSYWQSLIQEKAHSAMAVAAASVPAVLSADRNEDNKPSGGGQGELGGKDALVVADLESWILANTSVVEKFAQKYARVLVEAGIGSIDKLKKKLVRKPAYLLDLDFDEDDSDEIYDAVMGKKALETPVVHERDFKDVFDIYLSCRVYGREGRDELERIANDSSDTDRQMLAAGFLANANHLGGGKFTPTPSVAERYARQCVDWLKQNAAPITDENIAPSDIVQRPYSKEVFATTLLAFLYVYGVGITKNPAQGVKHLKSVLVHGSPFTHVLYGVCLNQSLGCTADNVTATQSFRIAAAVGYPVAVNNLAIMYRDGAGVQKDEREAVRLFKVAADQGYTYGMYNLGWMYYFGRGVSVDYYEAAKWLSPCYEQGDENAAYLLGILVYNGQGGMQQDRQKGKSMVQYAASKGVQGAIDQLDSL